MGKVFISDLLSNQAPREVRSYFALIETETRKGPNQTYVAVTLSDATGYITAYAFDDVAQKIQDIPQGKVLEIHGVLKTDRRPPLLHIKTFSIVEFYNIADLVPVTPADRQALEQQFFEFVHSVKHPPLRALLRYLFEEEKTVWEKFRNAPAAQKFHHAYLGGLLEHVVSLLSLAHAFAQTHPEVHRDLLLTGVILHDIGKIDELTYFPIISYTDSGRLLGHIILGYERVDRAIRTLRERGIDFPENLRLTLLHMILSHHGEKSWGSPVEPHTYEAQVLHFLDNLDAKSWMFRQAQQIQNDKAWVWQEGLRKQVFRDYP